MGRNIVERENTDYQHFLLFPQCFQKGCKKLGLHEELTTYHLCIILLHVSTGLSNMVKCMGVLNPVYVKSFLVYGSGPVKENSYFHYNIIQQNLLRLKRIIIVLLLPSHFFHFFLVRIIIYKSKTIMFTIQREIIITSLFKKK